MTQQFDEQLSAFVDDELNHTAVDPLIKKLTQDAELKQRWQNYHLIGDTLRGSGTGSVPLSAGFADLVMQALESEPTVLAPKSTVRSHASPMTKRLAGVAIAASVATIAVLGVQGLYQSPESSQLASMPDTDAFVRMPQVDQAFSTASNSNSTVLPQANGLMQASGPRSQVDLPNDELTRRIQNHLHRYLQDHTQNIDRSRVQGISPYARIVVSPIVAQGQNQ
jgi:sigma-E factor negative regulatory protein RseA